MDTNTNEPSRRELIAETEASRQGDESLDMKTKKMYPFSKSKVWHGLPGNLEVVYAQVKDLLHWEELSRITKSLNTNLTSTKIMMDQGAWSDEGHTIVWERYMQTEGLSQHVSCQHCKGMEKPIAVVFPGKDQQRRKLTCFCTDCWSFSSIRHNKTTSMDVSFFKKFNPETGKFHRSLPYDDDEHPRRIRGPITDHELDHFRKARLKLRKAGGPNKETNRSPITRLVTGFPSFVKQAYRTLQIFVS